ncbi:MAG: hypothetical protein HC888_06350 [Candidatus Competibacteraceae bacterium]|nr:hypothetical protein [Candidatus Competibacteraceae bacterium]
MIILGAAAATSLPRVAASWRALLAGVLFGAAATIKPHLVIGLPAVLWYLASEDWEPAQGKRAWLRRAIPCAVWGAGGLAMPPPGHCRQPGLARRAGRNVEHDAQLLPALLHHQWRPEGAAPG